MKADGEVKLLRLRKIQKERRQEREKERSETNGKAAETREDTLNKGKGNPVLGK